MLFELFTKLTQLILIQSNALLSRLYIRILFGDVFKMKDAVPLVRLWNTIEYLIAGWLEMRRLIHLLTKF